MLKETAESAPKEEDEDEEVERHLVSHQPAFVTLD